MPSFDASSTCESDFTRGKVSLRTRIKKYLSNKNSSKSFASDAGVAVNVVEGAVCADRQSLTVHPATEGETDVDSCHVRRTSVVKKVQNIVIAFESLASKKVSSLIPRKLCRRNTNETLNQCEERIKLVTQAVACANLEKELRDYQSKLEEVMCLDKAWQLTLIESQCLDDKVDLFNHNVRSLNSAFIVYNCDVEETYDSNKTWFDAFTPIVAAKGLKVEDIVSDFFLCSFSSTKPCSQMFVTITNTVFGTDDSKSSRLSENGRNEISTSIRSAPNVEEMVNQCEKAFKLNTLAVDCIRLEKELSHYQSKLDDVISLENDLELILVESQCLDDKVDVLNHNVRSLNSAVIIYNCDLRTTFDSNKTWFDAFTSMVAAKGLKVEDLVSDFFLASFSCNKPSSQMFVTITKAH